jgi:hypothetical protein
MGLALCRFGLVFSRDQIIKRDRTGPSIWGERIAFTPNPKLPVHHAVVKEEENALGGGNRGV